MQKNIASFILKKLELFSQIRALNFCAKNRAYSCHILSSTNTSYKLPSSTVHNKYVLTYISCHCHVLVIRKLEIIPEVELPQKFKPKFSPK